MARIKQSLTNIAKLAGVEPNENTALHWLSNIDQRWLLIIDNADDPNILVERYFPKGNRGHILVTTQNPGLKVHGNVGEGFFDFGGLESEDANQLLLKAARQPMPWDSACTASASIITNALGFLALAITHAGAVIRDGLCSLQNYLCFYERSWKRIRKDRNASAAVADITSQHMHIYTTWELCYQRIESKQTETSNDAIQLLKTFAFLHYENIRHDIFTRAVRNAALEEAQELKKEQEQQKIQNVEGFTWFRKFKGFNMAILMFLFKNRSPLNLPSVVRDARKTRVFDEYDDRIRFALRELVQMSLVTYSETNDSYSMHPIVHKWVRERPGMKIAEQGLWSEVAATLLSASILLPPLRHGPEDDIFNRDLLPHILHAQSCRNIIDDQISHRLRFTWTALLVPRLTLTPERVGMYAKFSLIYAQGGYWKEAKELLTVVKEYTEYFLGIDHEKTRKVTLALSEIYWNMGEGTEAAALQRSVLRTCKIFLSTGHPDISRAQDRLGQTLWQQGRYTEASKLQREAMEGLKRSLGVDHEDFLSSMDNLGRTVEKFWRRQDLEEAHHLHYTALKGMERIHGMDNPKTLSAKESLARVSIQLGEGYLQEAHNMMLDVLERRKVVLGKEHPYTLLAMVNTAIAKSALGKLAEAESLVRFGLPIADRNLGEDHIGTLFGRHILGSIFLQQKRYTEAEILLVDVSERQKNMSSRRGDYHPDRLGTLVELAKCYRLRGQIERSISVCDEALDGFNMVNAPEHPIAKDLKLARDRMAEHQRLISQGGKGYSDISAFSLGQYRSFHIF